MKKGKLLLQLILMYVVVLAALCVVFEGPKYIGKSYYETEDFNYEEQEFRDGLTRFVIEDISEEVLREKLLTVTEEERVYYREYYGSLPEQVENITLQYKSRLEEASSEEVRKLILAERDGKIADIKANFENDAHVDKKVLVLKERALNQYMDFYSREKQDFFDRFPYYNYELMNEETGAVYSKGDVTKNVLHRFTYSERNNFYSNNTVQYDYLADYLNNGEGLVRKAHLMGYTPATVTGEVVMTEAATGYIAQSIKNFKVAQISYYVLYMLGAMSIVLLGTKLRPVRTDFEFWPNVKEKLQRVPVDLFLVLWIFLACFVVYWSSLLSASFNYFRVEEFVLIMPAGFLLFCVTIVSAVWQYERPAPLQETLLYKLWQASKQLFLNRKIGTQSLLMLVVVFLAGFGFVATAVDSGNVLLYLPFLVFIFLPVLYLFIRRMGYLNQIMQHTKDMAEGRLTGDLKVKGKSPLAHHAENLNALRDGVKMSLTEQAKSERMKTELITNVSHDLRTPLTSIITYTDLLKNPELTEEERAKYIGILEVKSARLKTLIEDLFEVSKMASGNMELVRTQVDLAQLLQQTIGEQEEDFAAAGLDLRVTISEQPIFAVVDGQKWWRAIDNLIVNARKYSLEGTRVYVQLKVDLDVVEFTVKNVAKYELNEEAGELVERFKRADTSRHTEGSGLGLAIAQSIVDLHGGTMHIAVDGDLFKVTVKIPRK